MATISLRSALIVVSLGVSILATGCGDSNFNKKVEGVVTLNGKPLPNVRVIFVPVVNEGALAVNSAGVTDGNGNFAMAADNKKKGAMIAKHKVVIVQGRTTSRSRDDEDETTTSNPSSEKLPAEYTDASRTPIEVDVTPNKHGYNFDLMTSPGQ